MQILKISNAVVILFLIPSCTTGPAGRGQSADALLEDACRFGKSTDRLEGSVWMSLKSKDTKGQFPASVSAKAPDSVSLEVTNLLGGREALILVNRGSYSIEIPNKDGGEARKTEGYASWGGIPLRWASELFLGRIPCPSDRKG